MKNIFALCLFLCLLSCSDSESGKKDPAGKLKGYIDTSQAEQDKDKTDSDSSFADLKINQLTAEELHFRQKKGIHYEFSPFKQVNPLCRRFAGCLKFCSLWSHSEDCIKWSANAIIELWSSKIDSFSVQQKLDMAEIIAQDADISLFLHDSDYSNKILKKLFAGFSQMQCPMFENGDVYITQTDDDIGGRQVSLFLAHPEMGPAGGIKKIVGTSFYQFDLPLYKGFMRKCFNKKQYSFIEQAAEQENWRGFFMAHRILVDSCGDKSDCVKLAYCKLNSELLNKEIEDLGRLDVSVDFDSQKCSYGDFNSLPLIL